MKLMKQFFLDENNQAVFDFKYRKLPFDIKAARISIEFLVLVFSPFWRLNKEI